MPIFAALLLHIACAQPALAAPTAEPEWATVLESVTPAVVSIRMDVVRSFDTNSASNSQATGFVIDAEEGLILTNRHVVGPGPGRAEAVFLNNEEVDLEPIYRDPIHDFGIYRFNPEDVRHMDLVEVPLAPDGAQVGVEVRVIGNDAGEKISILTGTLARLDRAAPRYGTGKYNDFNTFYIQSASSTSGGSSGSPVIDRQGRVVALNAGGSSRAASSFFLPLHRVVYALEHIRAGQPVPRGSVQATFLHRPYDELRRLGLTEQTEARLREDFPDGTGALVVDSTNPGGPAHGALEPGDVLIAINGTPINSFVPLEQTLDTSVDQEITLSVERGGTATDVPLTVGDLHAITPDRYVEFDHAVLHRLSYQKARSYSVPVDGIYIADNGYGLDKAGISKGGVIRRIADRDVSTVEDLTELLATLPDGEQVRVEWIWLGNSQRTLVSSWEVDRRWFESAQCVRNDQGQWPCTPIAAPEGRTERSPTTATMPTDDQRLVRTVGQSLVTVDFDAPVRVDGVHGDDLRGTGVVVDAAEGLVIVDRDTVPIALGDVQVIVGGSVTIPGRLVWLHPTRNMAIVKYDPALLADTPIQSIQWSPKVLSKGKKTTHVGLKNDHTLISSETKVIREQPLNQPVPQPPFFREVNSKTLKVGDVQSSTGGVLVDSKGRLQALWASYLELNGKKPKRYFRGLPADELQAALDAYRADPAAPWPDLGAELNSTSLTDARKMGLSDSRSQAIEATKGRRRVLTVSRTTADAPAASVLRNGDFVLAANGIMVTEPWEVEAYIRQGAVELTILREGKEQTVTVEPHLLSTQGTERVLLWAGGAIQPVPAWVPQQRSLPPSGVYLSYYWYGTPLGRSQLRPTYRITAVNGTAVHDIDSFIAALPEDDAPVRLTYRDLQDRKSVRTLKPNPEAWPTALLERSPDGEWTRRPVD